MLYYGYQLQHRMFHHKWLEGTNNSQILPKQMTQWKIYQVLPSIELVHRTCHSQPLCWIMWMIWLYSSISKKGGDLVATKNSIKTDFELSTTTGFVLNTCVECTFNWRESKLPKLLLANVQEQKNNIQKPMHQCL